MLAAVLHVLKHLDLATVRVKELGLMDHWPDAIGLFLCYALLQQLLRFTAGKFKQQVSLFVETQSWKWNETQFISLPLFHTVHMLHAQLCLPCVWEGERHIIESSSVPDFKITSSCQGDSKVKQKLCPSVGKGISWKLTNHNFFWFLQPGRNTAECEVAD